MNCALSSYENSTKNAKRIQCKDCSVKADCPMYVEYLAQSLERNLTKNTHVLDSKG